MNTVISHGISILVLETSFKCRSVQLIQSQTNVRCAENNFLRNRSFNFFLIFHCSSEL